MLASSFQPELIRLYRQALAKGMAIEEVQQKIKRHVARLQATHDRELTEVKQHKSDQIKKLPRAIRWGAIILPLVFVSTGFYLVGSAVMPILGYYVTSPEYADQTQIVAPIPQEQVLDVTPLVITQNSPEQPPDLPVSTTVLDETLDYTNLSNWFSSTDAQSKLNFEAESGQSDEYVLDIPTLNIKHALVKVGGTNLNKSLIAYPGTALPGEYGAPVIFGHSVLRQFYNPNLKNPRRYNSIFSTIMTLKLGDKIYVTRDGVKYTYMVQEKKEVSPEDVYILTQQYDERRLKLVTCVPEGTFLRRGVVTAQLINE